MPIVTVDFIEGRTVAQKKELAEGITQAFISIGTPREAVRIIIRDMPKHNYAVGGQLFSEKMSEHKKR